MITIPFSSEKLNKQVVRLRKHMHTAGHMVSMSEAQKFVASLYGQPNWQTLLGMADQQQAEEGRVEPKHIRLLRTCQSLLNAAYEKLDIANSIVEPNDPVDKGFETHEEAEDAGVDLSFCGALIDDIGGFHNQELFPLLGQVKAKPVANPGEFIEPPMGPEGDPALICGNWRMGGARTLEEAAAKLEREAAYLRWLNEQGWQISKPATDDYGFIEKS